MQGSMHLSAGYSGVHIQSSMNSRKYNYRMIWVSKPMSTGLKGTSSWIGVEIASSRLIGCVCKLPSTKGKKLIELWVVNVTFVFLKLFIKDMDQTFKRHMWKHWGEASLLHRLRPLRFDLGLL